jgi:hypothetical protein
MLTGATNEDVALIPQAYFEAMDAVKCFHAKRTVRTTCCHDQPVGVGMVIHLKRGLDDLIAHFKK